MTPSSLPTYVHLGQELMRQLGEEARRFETALEGERASRFAEVKTQRSLLLLSLLCPTTVLVSAQCL